MPIPLPLEIPRDLCHRTYWRCRQSTVPMDTEGLGSVGDSGSELGCVRDMEFGLGRHKLA